MGAAMLCVAEVDVKVDPVSPDSRYALPQTDSTGKEAETCTECVEIAEASPGLDTGVA